MTRTATNLPPGVGIALVLVLALAACGTAKQAETRDPGKARADAKRQQAACTAPAAYDRLKNLVFDQAIGAREGGRANLDVLADYAVARMEDPVVNGFDPALDITRCKGRFILDIPAGAERGLGGARRLQADVDYTAQAAADGSGFVYRVEGAEPIVAKLAAFNLNGMAYRPPPAIDNPQAEPASPDRTAVAQADVPPAPAPSEPGAPSRPMPEGRQRPAPPPPEGYPSPQEPRMPRRLPDAPRADPRPPIADRADADTGEGTVRAFYNALREGNGAAASAQVIPEKRSGRAFSPQAIERFYNGLPEPLQLTGIAPLVNGAYRVSYRYSSGRARCNGSAVVRVTNRGGRELIQSIRALNGC